MTDSESECFDSVKFVFRIFVTVGRGAREGDDSPAGGGASP